MIRSQWQDGGTTVFVKGSKWVARAVLALVLGVFAAGCNSSGADSNTDLGPPIRGGTLDIATPLEPISLDPQAGQTDAGSQHAQDLIFDRLVEVRPGSADIVPGLAASWKLSSDRRSMTFHLRDAKFSDGAPVTSKDVKFSLDRASDPNVNPNFADSLNQQWSSITTPDSKTVVLHFDGPSPAVLAWLSFMPCAIISEAAFEKIGDEKEFARAPIGAGSGPFELVKWDKGQRVELIRNPNYWREGLPYVDAVNLLYIPDDNTRMLEVRSGEVDIADDVPYSQIDALDAADGVHVQTTKVAAQYGPWLSSSGPLKEPAVRQALQYAMPKEDIIKVALAGHGEPTSGFLPPIKYSDPDIPPYPYDVDKAKELIANSSVAAGFDLEIVVQAGDAVSRQTAQILQDAWSDIGADVDVVSLEVGAFNDRIFNGDFEAIIQPPVAASSDIPSEDEFAVVLTTPAFEQIFRHVDPKLRQLAKQIQGTWDEDERRQSFSEYQRQELENPVSATIATGVSRSAVRDNVSGFNYVLMNWFYLDETSIH